MGRSTPQQIAEKWARNLGQAGADIIAGVDAVTESPMVKAAAKKEKMLANLTASVTDGRWEAGLNRVTLEEWREAMKTKGVPIIAARAQSKVGEVAAFHAELAAHQDRLSAEIDAMPDITLQDSIARMTRQVMGMSEFRRS